MNIIRKARGIEIPKQAQHVFICCAVANASERETFAEDLLSHDTGMDCMSRFFHNGLKHVLTGKVYEKIV